MSALGSEKLDIAQAIAANGIMPWPILLGIGDEERSTDVLYVEGGEAEGNFLRHKSLFHERALIEREAMKIRVIDLDFGGAEVRHIEETISADFGGGHP